MAEPLFKMFRGDDYAMVVTIADEAGTPIDITGWKFWVTMKLSRMIGGFIVKIASQKHA